MKSKLTQTKSEPISGSHVVNKREGPPKVVEDVVIDSGERLDVGIINDMKKKRRLISNDDSNDLTIESKKTDSVMADGDDENEENVVMNEQQEEKDSSDSEVDGEDVGVAIDCGALNGNEELIQSINWKRGDPVPYRFIAETFAQVEAESGRLLISSILTKALRTIILTTPEDLLPAIYLCTNKLAPAHEGLELGIGESVLIKALSESTGRNVKMIKELFRKSGDLGDVAAKSRATQRTMFVPKPISVRSLFKELKAIGSTTGKSAMNVKQQKIVKLLVSANQTEAKYICRALQGKLRINLAEKTVFTSLAHAFVLIDEANKTKKLSKNSVVYSEELEGRLKQEALRLAQTFNELPVWDRILPVLLEHGTIDERLSEKCFLSPGVPVGPMLAKPTKGISEVITKFTGVEFTCEYKYDGERAQIHRLRDGSVKVYSRNAEDNTEKYPDLVEGIADALKEECSGMDFVMDAEAVAYDLEKKCILPFQELQTRARKSVKLEDIKVRVCLFAFDLLYLDGTPLLKKPLKQRRELLRKTFHPVESEFAFAQSIDSLDAEDILSFLTESIKAGCEGLMVKTLDGDQSTYEPANRSTNWLKVKKDYLTGLGDSVDLVPIGAYHGKGKRTGTFGAFLLACFDRDSDEYQTTCKVGTGFSDADLARFSEFYSKEDRILTAPKPYYRINLASNAQPDVWLAPVSVWEVLSADLSISPVHTAAIGKADSSKGIALRFPRFIRERTDKGPEDATSADQIYDLFQNQSLVAK
eukprot:CAMPEP_0182445126 /NCGR_PEP_ID=MMETSP1172-20130603/3362_1 /TAXON_ID=708627 /ORGANISM="Timspurckia oligopyrenoides, Strain CCMP3278" /LENGTH=758 /DNA_ID=CAMNT_0024640839 /DNA_START=236 /DNA_END=2512 /DNA_ORIENTATION=+